MVVFNPFASAQPCAVTPYPDAMSLPTSMAAMPCPQRFPPTTTVLTPVLPFGQGTTGPLPIVSVPSGAAIVRCSVPPIPTSLPRTTVPNTPGYNRIITTFVPIRPATTQLIPTIVPKEEKPQVPSSPTILQATLPPALCPLPPTTSPRICCPGATKICPLPSLTATTLTWKQSYGMEHVWQCEFQSLFSQYGPNAWLLLPINQKPLGVWNANVDSAKVRFCCEACGHGWTSMKGRVAFWFLLNPATGEGVVCLKLYGQQCDKCKKGNYETAMWYPEEVQKVLVNIYNRVGQVYYGFQQAPYHRARRPGKPRTPHNNELCQACSDGVCSERR